MTSRLLQVLLRVALLVALVGSTVLFIEYTRGASFCGAGGGCAAVKESAFSHIGPVGLPTIGIASFGALFAASLLVTRRTHARVLAGLLGAGALIAVSLMVVQIAVVKSICSWCMVVDASAILAALAATALARREAEVEPWPVRVVGWTLAGIVAVAAPLSWRGAGAESVALPPELIAMQQEGVKNVILFTDFQCPYCRKLHTALHARLAKEPGRAVVRRVMAPLPFHKAAAPAARAYVCAPEDDRDAMADRLYSADFRAMLGDESRPADVQQTLLTEALVDVARGLGLDPDAFRVCLGADETRRRVDDEFALYKSLQLPGLPTTFVDDKRILGANLDALEQALGGRDLRTMFALLGTVFVAVAGASLFRGRPV